MSTRFRNLCVTTHQFHGLCSPKHLRHIQGVKYYPESYDQLEVLAKILDIFSSVFRLDFKLNGGKKSRYSNFGRWITLCFKFQAGRWKQIDKFLNGDERESAVFASVYKQRHLRVGGLREIYPSLHSKMQVFFACVSFLVRHLASCRRDARLRHKLLPM